MLVLPLHLWNKKVLVKLGNFCEGFIDVIKVQSLLLTYNGQGC